MRRSANSALYHDADLPMTADLESLFRVSYFPPWMRM